MRVEEQRRAARPSPRGAPESRARRSSLRYSADVSVERLEDLRDGELVLGLLHQALERARAPRRWIGSRYSTSR